MNVLEDWILFLIWAAYILLNFDLNQKKRLPVWNLTKNASFIFFHGEVWSRYSEKNNFKISKNLTKNNKNKLKTAALKGNFKYQEAVYFAGYSL